MGLFSGKTITRVSSSLYNLAGEPSGRKDFVRSTVVGSVLSPGPSSVGDKIISAFRSGPGSQLKAYYRWAQNHYQYALPGVGVRKNAAVSSTDLVPIMETDLALNASQTLRFYAAEVGAADHLIFAEAWMAANRPDSLEAAWDADFDSAQSEITITIPDGAEPPNLETIVIAADADYLWALGGTPSSPRHLLYVSYAVITQSGGSLTQGLPALWTYRMGSGIAVLDALEVAITGLTSGEFFPVLPIRLNNVSITDPAFTDEYEAIGKAYKRLTGRKISSFIEAFEDNENLDDIDFAFIMQGVPLNTKDPGGLEYLFRFFDSMQSVQQTSRTEFDAWVAETNDRVQSAFSADRWVNVNRPRGEGAVDTGNPYWLAPAPLVTPLVFNDPPETGIRFNTEFPDSFDMRLSWNYLDKSLEIGNGKTFDGDGTRGLMRPGEYWSILGQPVSVNMISYNREDPDTQILSSTRVTKTYPRLMIFHQLDRFHYERIDAVGLRHQNLVYANTSVYLNAQEAMAETDESGFIVPLYYPTVRQMGLASVSQLASSCSYLVLNSYVQVKQKWYQTGFFKVLLMIVSVAISVIIPGAGLGLQAGVLGTNATVGVALGFASGTVVAAIAGAVANAVAAMLLSNVILKVAQQAFGEKLGAIIGTLISFIAGTYANAFAQTGSFAVDWSQVFRIDRLLDLTKVVGSAYERWLMADTREMAMEAEQAREAYEDKMDEINAKAAEILGVTGVEIDPMMFTDIPLFQGESRESFLGRSLLTGSEIVELSHSLIESYADISLTLPQALA